MTPEMKYLCESLDMLFDVSEHAGITYVHPHLFFGGEESGFKLYTVDTHVCKITTDRSFSEWYGYVSTDDEARFDKMTELICRRYGLEWDADELVLSITFRRNELTLAPALFRLEGAVLVLAEL